MSNLTIYKESSQELSNLEFVKNVGSQVRIKEAKKMPNFKEQLTMVMIKIIFHLSLKQEVAQELKDDVLEMILMRFNHISLDELSYAFKLERYGMYDAKTEHYQLFDANYVSEILNKYEKWKIKTRKENNLMQKKVVGVKLEEQKKKEIMESACERIFKQFKESGKILDACDHVYDYLDGLGKLPTSKLYKDAIFAKAKLMAKSDAMRKAGESIEMHRKLKVTLESIEKDKSKSVSIAKRLVLEEYFGKTEKL